MCKRKILYCIVANVHMNGTSIGLKSPIALSSDTRAYQCVVVQITNIVIWSLSVTSLFYDRTVPSDQALLSM